ncbi:hypothetical protein TYRP_022926 [Tyrophagus putrescentiae]|nr:hypothetical protein TYRP_022926 [Tyrophagus putrescentiae]
MSQVWMPGTQGTEYWPSGAKLKRLVASLSQVEKSAARVLVELSADVVKIGTGDEDDQASKSAACVKEEEVPFGEPSPTSAADPGRRRERSYKMDKQLTMTKHQKSDRRRQCKALWRMADLRLPMTSTGRRVQSTSPRMPALKRRSTQA